MLGGGGGGQSNRIAVILLHIGVTIVLGCGSFLGSGLHWMNLVAQQTCKSLLTNVKEVSLLSPFGSKQLSSDIREWEQSSTPHLVFPVLFKT